MLTLVIKKVFKRHDDLNISVAMRVNNAQKDLSDSSIRKKKNEIKNHHYNKTRNHNNNKIKKINRSFINKQRQGLRKLPFISIVLKNKHDIVIQLVVCRYRITRFRI